MTAYYSLKYIGLITHGGISVKREYYELKDETLKDLDLDINDIKKFNKVLQKIAKETNLIDKNVIKTIKQATRTQKIKSESVWDGLILS